MPAHSTAQISERMGEPMQSVKKLLKQPDSGAPSPRRMLVSEWPYSSHWKCTWSSHSRLSRFMSARPPYCSTQCRLTSCRSRSSFSTAPTNCCV